MNPHSGFFWTVWLVLLGGLPVALAESPAGKFTVPAGERQLFILDDGVAKMERLKRTLHQPKKRGAVIRGNPQLKIYSPQTRMAPVWDPRAKLYKLWDCGTTPAELHAKGFYTSRYLESVDGLHWTGPAMNQVEYQGAKNNNFVSLAAGGKQFPIHLAVYDPTDAALPFKTAVPNVGFFVSADGMKWTKLDAAGVPSADEYNLSFDARESQFILTVKVPGPNGRSVALSTSRDFRTWSKPELIFHSDELDQRLGREHIKARLANPALQPFFWNAPELYNVDVYNMGVFRYEGLFLGTPAMYHSVGRNPKEPNNTDGFHLVQLVASKDLKHWHRVCDRKTFIGPSPKNTGAYDLTQIIGPSAPVIRGDELWFYYTGIKYRDSMPEEPLDTDQGAICLATLRRDGFVSLDAASDGWLQTLPFKAPKGELHLNLATTEGQATVQVCDAAGKPILGFERSQPIRGDRLNAFASWPAKKFSSLAGQTITLRITLDRAQLYSYWIQ